LAANEALCTRFDSSEGVATPLQGWGADGWHAEAPAALTSVVNSVGIFLSVWMHTSEPGCASSFTRHPSRWNGNGFHARPLFDPANLSSSHFSRSTNGRDTCTAAFATQCSDDASRGSTARAHDCSACVPRDERASC
jgi:hypothetical protein